MAETEDSLADQLHPILGLLRRRRWCILTATVATTLGTVGIVYTLPNRYTSVATLFVVEQQVPERYVTPTSTTDLAQALPAMTQEVLSRKTLLDLVDQFNLFPSQRRRLAPEELEAVVTQYLTIEPLTPKPGQKEANAFKISFTAEKAILAQEVTGRLTSLFIQENLKTRNDQARQTAGFLHEQTEAAKEKLAQEEELVRDFKTKNLGQLPEQQQGNLAILNGAQLQLQNIVGSMDRAQQQRVYLESLLEQYQRLVSRGRSIAIPGAGVSDRSQPAGPYEAAQADLARLQADRARLAVTLQASHPDVIALDKQIAGAEARLPGLKKQDETAAAPREASESAQAPAKPKSGKQDAEEDASTAQLRSQLESNRLEVENLLKDEERQKALINEYQSRLNLAPVREQQLAGIVRDYDLSKKDYEDLLSKEQQSELAMTLEKEQGGEQFRVVDPPSLPNLPSSPKRLKMSLGGAGAGLALGLVVALLMEIKNAAFYTERDIVRRFPVPLVVALPVLVSKKEKRRQSVFRAFEWTAGTLLVTLVLVAEAWVYGHP
jgi:succinoglycan biosynthesis transport protein ExoP